MSVCRVVSQVCLVYKRETLTIAGKSSLTVRYVEGHFVESYYPTIENTFSHEIQYKGQTFLTEIIDTQGQVSRHCTRINNKN